jgi:hypothetical protein
MMYVLLEDDLGRLTLRRLRPWHRLLARSLAPRLDRKLAEGARPEATAALAARAARMTSMGFRRKIAASLQRIIAPAPASRPALPIMTPHIPLCRERIRRSAPELAELAGRLVQPGPVPAQGVAIMSELLTDGTGPLYHPACRDDLSAVIERAARALTAA